MYWSEIRSQGVFFPEIKTHILRTISFSNMHKLEDKLRRLELTISNYIDMIRFFNFLHYKLKIFALSSISLFIIKRLLHFFRIFFFEYLEIRSTKISFNYVP